MSKTAPIFRLSIQEERDRLLEQRDQLLNAAKEAVKHANHIVLNSGYKTADGLMALRIAIAEIEKGNQP